MSCYQLDVVTLSNDKQNGRSHHSEQLRLVLSQPSSSMITSTDDIIVGDFDGDTRDEVLIFTPSSGLFQVWKVSSGQFGAQQTSQFDLNEVHIVTAKSLSTSSSLPLQIRVGNFHDSPIQFDTTSSTMGHSNGNGAPFPSAFFHQMVSRSKQITRRFPFAPLLSFRSTYSVMIGCWDNKLQVVGKRSQRDGHRV
jgi:hypothetical protein